MQHQVMAVSPAVVMNSAAPTGGGVALAADGYGHMWMSTAQAGLEAATRRKAEMKPRKFFVTPALRSTIRG